MTPTADLELTIHRQEQNAYAVDFRFSDDSQAEVRLGAREQALVSFGFARLGEFLAAGELKEYSQALTSAFFGAESLRLAFAQARAASRDGNLRIRLAIAANALELHPLRWELLNDPQAGTPLATDQAIHFSRYLSSQDWRPVRLRSRGELKALVAVSSPSDLKNYKLADVDREAETARAVEGLSALGRGVSQEKLSKNVRVLPRSSASALFAALQEMQPDVLYLACHGYLVDGQTILMLENEQGQAEKVPGEEFVTRLKDLAERPRLVVLVSCQSGNGIAALGPRLAEAGIPAVLAMQDSLLMSTAAQLMPAFFAELQKDGQIDRALAVARGLVREQPDWWVPALFMRLKSGRLWYTPGFADAKQGFEKFPAIVRSIQKQRCTPILGPGLTEPLLGSAREIAIRWAEQFHYPMRPHERESLPQVAQYLSVQQSPQFPFDELEEVLKGHIRSRGVAGSGSQLRASDPLQAHIHSLGAEQRRSYPNEPHKLLAELPLRVFITTNPDTLLEDALTEAGREPVSMLCPWNEYIEQAQSKLGSTYQPTPDHPLVFHLFGRWDEPDSVVLTEDHYFDFLIGVMGNRKLIPEMVRELLSDSGLLFLGFQTEEWSFRVLYRSILGQEGRSRRRRYPHVAAQIEPDDERLLEPLRARRYLEQYFGGVDIGIYWGSPGEFLSELLAQYRNS